MSGRLLRYNARICAGLGPWLIVVPVAATMLVLFALMAMTSLLQPATPVLVLELTGPLLLAFVGASLLRPEYEYNTLETVLTRPVSFRLVLVGRLLCGALFVVALQLLLAIYMRRVMQKEFNLPLAMASTAASMAFLCALAIAVTAGWRSATMGTGVAGAFWALDAMAGTQLNPLLTARAYSAHIAQPDGMWGNWWLGKTLLVALAIVLALAAARAARQPAIQRSPRRTARAVAGAAVIVLVYIWSGAAYKVEWLRRQEPVRPSNSRLLYQQAFRAYGPVPVAYLVGPDFARLVGYRPPWVGLRPDPSGQLSDARFYEAQQLKAVAFGHPDSPWADNALFELGRALTINASDELTPSENTRTGTQCLELLVSEHPTSPFAPVALARLVHVYQALRQEAEAEAKARQLLELYPASEPAQSVGQAVLDRLLSQQRPREALWFGEKLAQHASDDDRPAALLVLGSVLASLARYDEAERAYAQALQEAETRALALVALGSKSPSDLVRLTDINLVKQEASRRLEALRAVTGSGRANSKG